MTKALCIERIQTRLGVALVSQVFRLNFAFDFFNLLLVRFHQTELIIVRHLILRGNNEACVSDGVEYSTFEYEYRKKLRVRLLILKNVLEYEYR